jgi:hypothetical protein
MAVFQLDFCTDYVMNSPSFFVCYCVSDCQHYVIPPPTSYHSACCKFMYTVFKKENSQKYKLLKTEGSWSLSWVNTYEGIEKNIVKVISHLGFYYFFFNSMHIALSSSGLGLAIHAVFLTFPRRHSFVHL